MKRATALLACTTLLAGLAACNSGGGIAGSGVIGTSSTAVSGGDAASGSLSSSTTSTTGDTAGTSSSSGSAPASTVSAPAGTAAGTVGTTGAEDTSPKDATIQGMLALVPASVAGDDAVVINLYWKAAAAGGLTMPDAAGKAQTEYAMDLTTNRDRKIGMVGSDLLTQLASPVSPAGPPILASDIAADVQAGQPPRNAIAALGNFDTSAIDTTFRNNTTWADDLTTPSYHGHAFYRWMDDLKMDVTKRYTGLFTDLGQSRRIAFPDPSTFLYSRDDDTMHALLDATDDPGSTSLAADDAHLAVAAALDDNGVYSAMILGQQLLNPLASSPGQSAEQAKKVIAEMRKHALKPYLLAGIGETLVDGSPRTVIVLANADADAARANAEALRGLITDGRSLQSQRPWSDFFGIDSVTTDGSLTIGVLTLTDPTRVTTWYRAVTSRDTLLAAG